MKKLKGKIKLERIRIYRNDDKIASGIEVEKIKK